ncbi:MAG TPA: riboflavin biosynthesis protein RibF, partial [Ruminococcus sp.]|nr:riboflavin biosynthesis protein RibF [Ruminococcus sp.]
NRAAWGVADLAAFGETFGFTVELIDAVEQDGAVISSSRIRQLLLDGKIQQANRLLGAPYQISGIIQHGAALGRTIQFPTINLSFAPEQLVPLYGVYRAKVYLKDGSVWNGVTNIGTKPTVSNACIPVAETHLLGFQGDLYGQFCRIELLDFLRKEQKFSGLDELKAAIADNIRTVQAACKQ